VPTWTAFAVSQLLEAHLPNLVDYQFTAQMEDELDAISRGELSHLKYLNHFYYGNGHPGLKEQLKNKAEEIDARDVCRILVGKPEGQDDVFIRVGRYGPFLEQGERRSSLPDKMAPDEVTLDVALQMLDKAAQGDQPLGICPETGKPIFVKIGRFGPYVQRGSGENDEKPQNASLLKGMQPEDVTVEMAVKLLSLPRELGADPANGLPVVAYNGRYGPYVKCGEETRSLPADVSPLDVTLEQSLALLAQPKAQRGGAARKEPIKVFDPSPVTGKPVQLLAGRYGPYVTDGVTNASLPRETTAEEVTVEYALNLLKERAEAGPSKKRAGRRGATAAATKSAPKKAVMKKAAKKKTAEKKAAKKKTASRKKPVVKKSE